MRDGLITPAPYSAPAAYYIPTLSDRKCGGFKGPAATAYGPHTVGGAINLASFHPGCSEGSLIRRLRWILQGAASYGAIEGGFGYVLDLLSYGADGFKRVDRSNQDTGFERNDIGIKLAYALPQSRFEHRVSLLLEVGDEVADETYLGLTDDDFELP